MPICGGASLRSNGNEVGCEVAETIAAEDDDPIAEFWLPHKTLARECVRKNYKGC